MMCLACVSCARMRSCSEDNSRFIGGAVARPPPAMRLHRDAQSLDYPAEKLRRAASNRSREHLEAFSNTPCPCVCRRTIRRRIYGRSARLLDRGTQHLHRAGLMWIGLRKQSRRNHQLGMSPSIIWSAAKNVHCDHDLSHMSLRHYFESRRIT